MTERGIPASIDRCPVNVASPQRLAEIEETPSRDICNICLRLSWELTTTFLNSYRQRNFHNVPMQLRPTFQSIFNEEVLPIASELSLQNVGAERFLPPRALPLLQDKPCLFLDTGTASGL